MANDNLHIAGEIITAGSLKTIALPVSNTATGINANLWARILHGVKPGPRLFVSAAVHGDEIIGTAIIQQLLKALDPQKMAGTVIFVPAVNIFGFASHSRYLPDRRDLNRSFPGSANGSLAGQLAYIFLNEIIAGCSLGIDIHSAARHRYNLPQIRIAPDNEKLRELAGIFGAPAIIESPLRDGSLRDIARNMGVDMLLMEAGEALRFDDLSIRAGVTGVMNILAHLDIVDRELVTMPDVEPARSTRSTWLRAPRGGVCHMQKVSGDVVPKGEVLAEVSDIFGDETEIVTSPFNGIIIGHSNLPVVNQGDALLHIARVKQFDTVEERVDSITEMLLDEDEVI